MDKTFTMSCDFEIVIRGNYSICDMWEEDLETPITKDDVWFYVTNNITDFYTNAQINISNEKIEEET